MVAGLSERGPASKTGLRTGDRILAVRDEPVASLASFWRRVWASGPAGSEVVLAGGARQGDGEGAHPLGRPHPVAEGAQTALNNQWGWRANPKSKRPVTRGNRA